MDFKPEPNFSCPDPNYGAYPGAEITCNCDKYEFWDYWLDCLAGEGTCEYTCFTTYWKDYLCHAWYTLVTYDCGEAPSEDYHHENDIPRTILYNYNLTGGESCFCNHWKLEDQNVVIRFTNLPTSTNIRVLVDPSFFIP